MADFSNGFPDLNVSPQKLHSKIPRFHGAFLQDCKGQVGTQASNGPRLGSALVRSLQTESGFDADFWPFLQQSGVQGMEAAPLEFPFIKEAILKPDILPEKELAQSKPRKQAGG